MKSRPGAEGLLRLKPAWIPLTALTLALLLSLTPLHTRLGTWLSDLVLALRMFILKPPRTRLIAPRLLWPLYWGGQALILFGWG